MLQGTLEDFDLPALLSFLSSARKTGRLVFKRPTESGRLDMIDGQIVAAETDRRPVEEASLDPAVLHAQIEECATEMASWDSGEFVWTSESGPEDSVIVRVDAGDLVAAVSRRIEEAERLRARISEPLSVVRISATPPPGAEQINITAGQWRLLALIDGTRTVAEIAGRAGVSAATAASSLYDLACSGLVEVDPGPSLEMAEEVRAVPIGEGEAGLESPATEPVESAEPTTDPAATEPVEPSDLEVSEEPPAAFPPARELPQVDRAAAVRELAGLSQEQGPATSLDELPRGPAAAPSDAEGNGTPPETRGLVSRFMRRS